MAQLTDDCFAFGGPLIPVEEAAAMIRSRLVAVAGDETVTLAEADGRVLAEELTAPLALPPFTNSAVDGYAVRAADLPVGAARSFVVTGRVQAGTLPVAAVGPGEAVRIFTGAVMPDQADTVYMQEDVQAEAGGSVLLPAGLRAGANVRPAGEDVAAGGQVLPAGRRMRPQDVALIAALGLDRINVRRRVNVAVFSTGNEVVAPGALRGAAQIFDSNRVMLTAMLKRLGCHVTDLGILGDDAQAIAAGLTRAARTHDLIVTSGGVSTGQADLVRSSVEMVGTLVLWRMAIKPGRPVAMGLIEDTPFIGLPGNPVASFVTFAHIARPAILTLAGAEAEQVPAACVRARFSYRKKAGRREYVRVRLYKADDGMFEADKFPHEGAGLLSSLVDTDGLVELAEGTTAVEPGDRLAFLSYPSLL